MDALIALPPSTAAPPAPPAPTVPTVPTVPRMRGRLRVRSAVAPGAVRRCVALVVGRV